MAKFIILYHGPATDMEDMTEEQGKAIMDAWGAWMQKTGDALLDIGAPMAKGTTVVDDGSLGKAEAMNGYSIIEADSMGDAQAIVEGHPFLSEGEGRFKVDIFELLPVPFES